MHAKGWTLYWHPAFKEQFEKLHLAVRAIKKDRPAELATNGKARLLKRVLEIILEEVPEDPNHQSYQQGNTLGEAHRNWRRAMFLQRFRLFFRFSTSAKIIIYSWVNDKRTLRQAGAKTDVYEVFEKQLRKNDPPNDWDDLLKKSEEMPAVDKVVAINLLPSG